MLITIFGIGGKHMDEKSFSAITPQIKALAKKCKESNRIDVSLYDKHQVKRGLRDVNGKGVLTGLTEISEIKSSEKMPDGTSVPCEGKLYYRGIDVEEIIKGFNSEKRFGFEEVTYLLIFGKLPNVQELKEFNEILGKYRCIPSNFVRDIIMKKPSSDIMNSLARSVLMLYAYDDKADDISIPNVVRQSLQLISEFPLLAVYSYQAYRHAHKGGSLIIHEPRPELSTAENILHLLRADSSYTPLEAKILDLALVLHAEHGGGNNSTFTTHVVTSSGTDTYSSVVASLGSLKGPKHGGANIRVVDMVDDIKANLADYTNEEKLKEYLKKILNKQAGDGSGLIYGMGHAVYTLSDPRARILKGYAEKFAKEKGREDHFELLSLIEKLTPSLLAEHRGSNKKVCANVDLYSGFLYEMLGIPRDLFTPLFMSARVAGWCAHRIEEITSNGKIVRPAYKNVNVPRPYVPIAEREENFGTPNEYISMEER